jgi:hypothetical protein
MCSKTAAVKSAGGLLRVTFYHTELSSVIGVPPICLETHSAVIVTPAKAGSYTTRHMLNSASFGGVNNPSLPGRPKLV